MFQSAPRVSGATALQDRPGSTIARFNPRPAMISGATQRGSSSRTASTMFQSAPRDVSGATSVAFNWSTVICMFQSAPRDDQRGDLDQAGMAVAFRPFQSAPRVMRGDVLERRVSVNAWRVSIRAPRDAGRRTRAPTYHAGWTFQSAPRDDLRGDNCAIALRGSSRMFQSAPRVSGATRLFSRASRHHLQGFNPRPAMICGATGQGHL